MSDPNCIFKQSTINPCIQRKRKHFFWSKLNTQNNIQEVLRKFNNLKLVDGGAVSVKEYEEALLNQFNSLFESQIFTPFRTKYRPSQVVAKPSCNMIILVMCANHVDLVSHKLLVLFNFLRENKCRTEAYGTTDASSYRYMWVMDLKFGLNSSCSSVLECLTLFLWSFSLLLIEA